MHATNGNIVVGKDLKMASLNIRGGLKDKKAEIEIILERYRPDFLGLSETNQSCHDSIDYDDTMYNFVPGFTYSQKVTRVGILVRKGLFIFILFHIPVSKPALSKTNDVSCLVQILCYIRAPAVL